MSIKSTLLTISLLPLGAYAFGPSGPPNDPSTAMYSISDVCQRLESGASGEKRVFTDPNSAPGTKISCNFNLKPENIRAGFEANVFFSKNICLENYFWCGWYL
jgi:hypothetical protein